MNLRTLATTVVATVAIVLSTCAATASATVVLGPDWNPYTSTIEATNESGHAVLTSAGVKVECSSSIVGKVETDGSGITAEGKLSSLTFKSCTNGNIVNVKKGGSLIFHTKGEGTGNGTVTSTGAEIEVTVKTIFGTLTCIYTTSSTDIGTLTGTDTTLSNATLDISATVSRTGGSELCGSTATWTGSYLISTPWALTVNDQDVEPIIKVDLAQDLPKFKENDVKEPTIEDDGSKIAWTLVKVEVSISSGGWSLENAATCSGIMVKAKGAVCKVKIKCLSKGDALLMLYVSYGKISTMRGMRMRCA
ncbi:MAG TPA: hypothetical protein VNM38_05390 [Solirubrobacterales bacterium]|nr:hypothetical protein [Solirubrobacterales bacterium]